MGRIFTVPPSVWEVDHWRGVRDGLAHQRANDGQIPDTPMWHMLERRYDIDLVRFELHHPNLSQMIERSRDALDRPPIWPIDREGPFPPPSCTTQPPSGPLGPQVVPEPAGWIPLTIAIVIALLVNVAAFVWGKYFDRPLSKRELRYIRSRFGFPRRDR